MRPLGQAMYFPHKYTAFKDVRLSTLFSMKRSDSTVTHCHRQSPLSVVSHLFLNSCFCEVTVGAVENAAHRYRQKEGGQV